MFDKIFEKGAEIILALIGIGGVILIASFTADTYINDGFLDASIVLGGCLIGIPLILLFLAGLVYGYGETVGNPKDDGKD